MKIKVKKRYLKHSKTGRSPIRFHAEQPRGIGTTVHAVIVLDPILKSHSDLKIPILKHEIDEIKHWGEGKKSCSHSHAKSKEPKLTRNLSVCGFWNEIKRRRKHGR
jgi:hypothetical protein